MAKDGITMSEEDVGGGGAKKEEEWCDERGAEGEEDDRNPRPAKHPHLEQEPPPLWLLASIGWFQRQVYSCFSITTGKVATAEEETMEQEDKKESWITRSRNKLKIHEQTD